MLIKKHWLILYVNGILVDISFHICTVFGGKKAYLAVWDEWCDEITTVRHDS